MVELPSSSTRGFRVHCYDHEECAGGGMPWKAHVWNTQVLKDSVRERIPE